MSHKLFPRSPSGILIARKSVEESVSLSTTLQNDDELWLSLPSNSTWMVDGLLLYDAATAADISVYFTAPTGASYRMGWLRLDPSVSAFSNATIRADIATEFNAVTLGGAGGTSNICTALYSGSVVMGANPGNLQLMWAQAASSGTQTRVWAGSTLRAMRIA